MSQQLEHVRHAPEPLFNALENLPCFSFRLLRIDRLYQCHVRLLSLSVMSFFLVVFVPLDSTRGERRSPLLGTRTRPSRECWHAPGGSIQTSRISVGPALVAT